MNILSIETATPVAAVALVDAERSVAVEASRDMHHVETLVPTIEDLLKDRSWSLRDLDLIVVDVGPGLFTGLRVGVSAARSLAAALGCAIAPVTSLEVLASSRRDHDDRWAVVDARRGEVFAQHFVADRGVSDPMVLTPDRLAGLAGAGAVLIGDGAHRYGEVFLDAHLVVEDEPRSPSPLEAIEIARSAYGGSGVDLASVVPLYLRDPDAVANFHVLERFRT